MSGNKSLDLYKHIFSKSINGKILINRSSIIIDNNDKIDELFGYNQGELIGKNISILMPPAVRERHATLIKDAYEKKREITIGSRKLEGAKKDGTKITIELGVFTIMGVNPEEDLYIGIVRNLEDLIRYEQNMLEEIEERNMFAANISHELRTPLNTIINGCAFLDDELSQVANAIPTPAMTRAKDYIEMINHAATVLLTQINDVLDYSKLIAQKMKLKEEVFSINTCLDSVIKIHKTTALNKGIELLIDVDPEMPNQFIGDSERITQILINLISNAIKFTANGKVILKCWSILMNTGIVKVYFSVADTGIGISEENKSLLFKSFRQLDNSHSKQTTGTGLGLVICKQLSRLMGGDTYLKSSVVGLGSTFEFNVCLKIPENAQFRIDNNAKLKGKQVLLVDDEAANLNLFSSYLLEMGMVPFQTNTGTNALVYVKNKMKFDLAILDINMPKMNGIELAHKIRTEGGDYPLVAISSVGVHYEGLSIFKEIAEKPITKINFFKLISRIFDPSVQMKVDVQIKKIKSPILVAEDDINNQKIIRLMLEKLGYIDIDIVDDGSAAVKAMLQKKYKIALLDIKMPIMNGIDVARKMIESYNDRTPIMIALTAFTTYSKEYYVENGMNDYISKPINQAELKSMLEKYNDSY